MSENKFKLIEGGEFKSQFMDEEITEVFDCEVGRFGPDQEYPLLNGIKDLRRHDEIIYTGINLSIRIKS